MQTLRRTDLPVTQKSTREALRSGQVERIIRRLCKDIEDGRESASFQIRGEAEYPSGHKVFIRVLFEAKQTGFYVIPESEHCLVCFFKDRHGPSLSRRFKRLMGFAQDYDELRVRRKRKTLQSVTVRPDEFSDSALSEWLEYVCSGCKWRKKPAILKN
jgi:hypothetical protein